MTDPKPHQHRLHAALAHHQAGRFEQADQLYEDLLKDAPDQADAWHLRGLLAHQRGSHETALAWIERGIQLRPGDGGYRINLAEALLALGRREEAVQALREAIALEPALAMAHANLGNVLYEGDAFEESLAHIQEALRLDPASAPAWNTFGNLKEARGAREEAQAAYGRALELDPGFARARANLAISLERSEDFEGAGSAYEAALRADPGFADAHWNYALMLLKTGRFERGWREYEWRWGVPKLGKPARAFPQPLWEGEELSGRSVLMHAEQGFGDAIHYVRYAPLLAERGARVLLECPKELQRLFLTVEGVSEVIAAGEPLPPTDFQVPFMSLPRAFRTNLETIPTSMPYLAAAAEAVAHWRERFSSSRPTVGLVWATRPTPRGYNAGRSVTLQSLAPLLEIPGLDFVGLQKGAGREQLEDSGFRMLDLGPEIDDFADLAAILGALDLLVSVDTAAAHLGGALGLPVWMLVPKPPAFQWLLRRTDSPWYPSLRLFRQETEGDWSAPLQSLADALRSLAMA